MMDSLESDMKLLLDSLQCSTCDADQQIVALKTLAMLCNDDQKGDCIRKLKGLELIMDIFCNASLPMLKQWSLYVLSSAVQNSTPNKKRLCSANLLAKISMLLNHKVPNTMSVFASNFLLSLCSNFAHAQDLSRESGCLRKLIMIFKLTIPKAIEWFDSPESISKKLWTTVSSTLCSAMSHPQNDSNKLVCAEVLPQAISVLRNANKDVLCSSLNFISHVVNSNGQTQRMLKIVGGLNSLVALLSRQIESRDNDDYITSVILQTISSGLTHYESNKQAVGSLGIISMLIDMINYVNLSDVLHTSCLVCLSRCVDDCDVNINLLLKCNGIQSLVSTIVNASSEEARKIAILILQNSKISQKESVSLKAECRALPSRTADVSTKREHFQSKQNGNEESLDLVRTLDANIKVNAMQHEKDSAVLSMLADHRELLMNVTRHLSEMKDQFKEYSDASTTSSKLLPKMRQRGTNNSVISSSYTSGCVGRSYFDKKTGKDMILVPRGNGESNAAFGSNNSFMSSPLTSLNTVKKIGINGTRNNKVNIAKCAIMNAHEQSKKPNLFVASKIGVVHNKDAATCKEGMPNKILSDHATSMEVQKFGKERERMNDVFITSQSSGELKNNKSAVEKKVPNRKGKSDKCKNVVVADSKAKEGIRTRSFYKTDHNNGDIKRLCREDRRRVMKQRLKGLPTVIENVPMLEQSNHERVQGWIDSSLPVDDVIADETTSQIMEKHVNKERGDSLHGGTENTEWENVSSIMLSKDEDKSEGSHHWLTDDSSEIAIESEMVAESIFPCKSDKRPQAEIDQADTSRNQVIIQKCDENQAASDNFIGECTITHSPINDKSVSSMQNDAGKICESITPSSILPSRVAKNFSKAKRSIAFNKEDVNESVSEKGCSSIVITSEKGGEALPDFSILPESKEQDIHAPPQKDCRDGRLVSSQSREDIGDHLNKHHANAQSASIRNHHVSAGSKGTQMNDNSKCLGCYPFARFPFFILNKRNFITALQKDNHTCDFHRKLVTAGLQVNDFQSASFERKNTKHVNEEEPIFTEAVQVHDCSISKDVVSKSANIKEAIGKRTQSTRSSGKDFAECCSVATTTTSRKRKRKRKEYEDFEIENIYKGVQHFGKRWTSIINAYEFQSGRTAEDLKGKFKRLCKGKNSIASSTVSDVRGKKPMPFTSEEIINLKTGYGRYGARWKTILNSFKFQSGRTARDLENRYARLCKI